MKTYLPVRVARRQAVFKLSLISTKIRRQTSLSILHLENPPLSNHTFYGKTGANEPTGNKPSVSNYDLIYLRKVYFFMIVNSKSLHYIFQFFFIRQFSYYLTNYNFNWKRLLNTQRFSHIKFFDSNYLPIFIFF
jgi:hypothetical protein